MRAYSETIVQEVKLVLLALFVVCFAQPHVSAFDEPQANRRFVVELPAASADKPITGRLFVFLTQGRNEPRFGPDWFAPEPFFAKNVENFTPGTSIEIDGTADSCPVDLTKIKPGKYRAQALFDHDFYSPVPATGAGNLFSEVAEIEVPEGDFNFEFKLTKVVESEKLPENDWVKPIVYRSEILSQYFKRDVEDRAIVVLPKSYLDNPERRFPVVYVVSGFGGTLPGMAARNMRSAPTSVEGEIDSIRVYLTGECKYGHHVYADSAMNGPRGRVLVEELIPKIDREFRTVADSRARFVTGHSSGGWSSLWLQVTYPDVFGGVWSTSPDPVDFRDYQQTNLYAEPPQSIYFDQSGAKKPLARRGTQPVIWYPDFGRMDDTLGRGGQLRSFEAVFSPLDENGLPQKMWDRKTGAVNPQVVEAWKKYDINLVIRSNWKELEPKLQGKVHVSMGTLDTFYLNGATQLLKETFAELKSDAQIEMIPDADHSSVLTQELRSRQRREMQQAYSKYFDVEGQPIAK